MALTLKRHWIAEASRVNARDIGGKITPEIVVLHDTAGALAEGSAVSWLSGNPAKTSCHFVIERDGGLTQMVPTNRRANHAGKSHYHDKHHCNRFSIGIELVNPGKMAQAGRGLARAWWGEEFDCDEYGIVPMETPEHGAGLWMPHTPAQAQTLIDLLIVLFGRIPSLMDIRGHWYVSPGRKVDPNPCLDVERLRALILGRDDAAEADAHDRAMGMMGRRVSTYTPGDVLNMRRWPSFNPNVIGTIPDGTVLDVDREGVFDGRPWLKVRYGQREGWIVKSYTEEVTP